MPKPLAGIRVIELANFIAGPLCGTLLADMGADVIKVEPPRRRHEPRHAADPQRRERELHRAQPQQAKPGARSQAARRRQEVMRKLAAKSDVFVEANRPGALEKMGLGATDLKAVNPKIIYTSVSGFGQTGPDRRRAGVNLIIEAFSGVLSVTGEPGKMPMRPGVQTADVFGALFATYATLAEPRRRRRATAKAASPTSRWSKPRSRRPPGRRRSISRPARCRSRWATGTASPRPISCSRPATSATSRSARRTTCCSRSSCRRSGLERPCQRSALCHLRQPQGQRGCAAGRWSSRPIRKRDVRRPGSGADGGRRARARA